jgi:mono/diheme cytochrome c family protein
MEELFKLSAGALLIAAMLFSSSCKHEPWIPDGYLPSPDDTTTTSATCDPDTSYFVNDVMPIFASSCAMSGCHDAITSEGGIRLTDYQSIISTGEIEPGNPNESKVWKAITESEPQDRMPPLSSGITLTQEQRDAVFDWISQGSLNNACTENNCDTIDVSYASNVRPIFELHCLGCHTGAAVAGGGIPFDTYAQVATYANNGDLMGALNHQPGFTAMPYGQPKLNDCKIATIRNWINEGTQNN